MGDVQAPVHLASAADTRMGVTPLDLGQRKPPWSEEAEQSLLGSLLQDNACMALVTDVVGSASFYSQAHRLTFEALEALLRDGRPADVVSVWDVLVARGQAKDAGGLPYLTALHDCVPSARNARTYAEIVAERAAERTLIAGLDSAAAIAWDSAVPLDDRMERVAAIVHGVEQARKQPTGRRVPMLRLQALREASQSVRWLCKRVVPADSIGMMFGGSGTFKSFIALDLALHVAHGLPWMGRKTVEGQVLFIAAEGGAGLWPRIEAWHKMRGLRWHSAPIFVVPAAVDLQSEAWRVVDAAQLVGAAPALVVVDTLSQTYSGEENSANEMAAYLRELGARFRALWNCAVLLVHHSGHQATERPRGSSAIRANLDFLLGVFRDEKEMLATVSCVKQKDGELFQDATFHLQKSELGVDDDGDPITSLVARHLSSDDEVQRAVAAEQQAGRGGRNQMLMNLVQNGSDEKGLRKAFYDELISMGVSDGDTRKKAYYRARQWAVDQGLIQVVEGFVIDFRGRK